MAIGTYEEIRTKAREMYSKLVYKCMVDACNAWATLAERLYEMIPIVERNVACVRKVVYKLFENRYSFSLELADISRSIQRNRSNGSNRILFRHFRIRSLFYYLQPPQSWCSYSAGTVNSWFVAWPVGMYPSCRIRNCSG